MPLPGIEEQRRISATLDSVDAIRHSQRERERLLDALLGSSFVQIFGDPVKNEKGWKVVRLGEELSFLTSGSRGWSRYYSKSGRPFLRIQNVGHNRLILNDLAYVDPPSGAEAARTAVRAGDIVLSITADLGRTAVVVPELEGGHINQHLALLRTRDFDPFYLAQFLASEGGQRQLQNRNRQAVKAGLNFDDIRSLMIPDPPTEMQAKFAAVYHRIEVARTTLEKASDVARQLFDSIAHSKFDGDPWRGPPTSAGGD
jgi:type I restriction enzyme S subunit